MGVYGKCPKFSFFTSTETPATQKHRLHSIDSMLPFSRITNGTLPFRTKLSIWISVREILSSLLRLWLSFNISSSQLLIFRLPENPVTTKLWQFQHPTQETVSLIKNLHQAVSCTSFWSKTWRLISDFNILFHCRRGVSLLHLSPTCILATWYIFSSSSLRQRFNVYKLIRFSL